MSIQDRFYDDLIYSLKYRPSTITETILPERLKEFFRNIIDSGNVPNMLFYGSAGVSKTTVATIIADTLSCDTMYINGSEETSIDVVRTKLTQFCASQSMFQNNKKIVIYDEAEAVSNAAFQALRPFIEQYSKNTSFIFITNYKNKFSEPILSRLQSVEFIFTQDEQQVMKREFYKRVIDILAKENVTNYNKKVVAHIVSNLFPDMRKILNEIQKHAQSNNLENLAIIQSLISDCNKYFKLLKNRDFYGIQGFISQTSDPNSFFTQLYNEGVDYVDESSISPYYVLLGDYAYRNSFIVDYRINLTALSMKIINEITLKD